jgi:hypothetical protein
MRARPSVTLVLVALAGAAGCSHPPPDSSAVGAVRLFLDDMEAADEDPRVMRRAYDLLGPTARANLEERARHTARAQGRQVQPWEMLAAGRFGLAFRPKTMRQTVVGDRASVEVLGANPSVEQASIVCVREAAGWRIEPQLPEP